MSLLNKKNGLILSLCLLVSLNVSAFVPSEQFSDIQYKDLVTDTLGYISNTTGDGYLVLNNINLNRAQMCGLQISLEFKETPQRATVFDLYWRTAQTGFSESQKSFFMINQKEAANKNTYIVPLCKLFSFSGNLNQPLQQANIIALRFDYPPNKDIALRIENIQFLDSETLSRESYGASEVIIVEPYERVSADSFTSLDVIIPKLIFAFEEGLKRLSSDVPFLIFWLVLIFLLKGLILLSYTRQFKTDDD